MVANQRVAGVGERENTWGARVREPDDLVLHIDEREGVAVVEARTQNTPLRHLGMSRGDGRGACKGTCLRSGSRFTEEGIREESK